MKNTEYRIHRIIFFVVCLFLSLSSALGQSTQRTRYVKPTATGTMDGTSWVNAMTLQAALDGYMTGDLLYLMRGNYTPTAKKSDGMAVAMGEERDATYVLPNGITIYGGFVGYETSHTARTMSRIHSTNATTIEGDIGTTRTTAEANNTDNIKRLFLLANNGTATLDGLTVARANGERENGGGLNSGGGMGGNITLRLCRFIDNAAGQGAAVWVGSDGTLTVTNSTFAGNSSGDDGGAIFVSAGGTLTTTGSTFRENTAGNNNNGSAIHLASTSTNPSTTTISRCSFFENSATGNSFGAVYANTGVTLHISSSVFVGNSMEFGVAVFSVGNGTFINNTVYNNRNRTSGTAAVAFLTTASTWVVANNIIYGNTGTHQVNFADATNKTMAHNFIQGNSINNGPASRIGMITAPMSASDIFVDTIPGSAGYLQLATDSPALQAGNNDYIDGDGTTAYRASQGTTLKDRAGNDRVFGTTTVDVGAYELRVTPRVRYVKPVGTGTGNGSSWVNAMDLQAALDGYMAGDFFYLMKGSYTPAAKDKDGMVITDIREATYALSDRIILYGGFAGTETGADAAAVLAAREMSLIHSTNATTIEGDIGALRTETDANNDDNVKQLFHLSAGRIATLDGLTVARAYNTAEDGAGLRAESGSNMTLRNCRFLGNRARDGGAIFVRSSVAFPATLTVTDCTFGDNEANTGGGIRISVGGRLTATGSRFERNRSLAASAGGGAIMGAYDASLTVTNCTFERNSSANDGGAIYASGGALTTTGGTFEMNSAADDGGAIYAGGGGTLTTTGGTFEMNSAADDGGAIYAGGGGTLTTTGGTFEGNSAANDGGAIYVSGGGTLTTTGSTFRENTVGEFGDGSAIYLASSIANPSTGTISRCTFLESSGFSGTAYAGPSSTLHVSNSVFANNRIVSGSALYSSLGHGTFINNTVYGNNGTGNNSTAVYLFGSTTTWVVANNIIYGNTGGEHQVWFAAATNKTMAHNLIQGNSIENGPTRTGPLTDPGSASRIFLSTDPMHEDYLRLIPGNNVGVDAGANNYIDGNADAFEVADTMNLPDRAGDPRINNTTVDAGAYELDSEATALHVADALGNILHPSGKLNFLAAAGGTVTLRVFYAGTDATMGVTIAETADEGNIISALTTSVPSSRSNATFTLAANTASSRRTATLTFTLTGVTPAVSLVIPFTQRRGTASAIYVTTSGSETANGTSWADAMDLHTALMDGISGDSIYVGAGSYTPTRLANGTTFVDPRDGVFGLPDGVTLYGGFVGTETGADAAAVLAAREASRIHSTNATIIEGDIGTMRTEAEANNDDNIKRLFLLAAGDTATLDGLTVARAFNSATGAAADGGGLRAESGTNMTLRNCRFIGHRSHDGGAIVVKSTVAAPARLMVMDCIFEDNEGGLGGAICIETGGTLTATGSTFKRNSARGRRRSYLCGASRRPHDHREHL